MSIEIVENGTSLLTDNHVWRKLQRNWHDYLLKCKKIVCVLHALLGPGNVHRTIKMVNAQTRAELETYYPRPAPCPQETMLPNGPLG